MSASGWCAARPTELFFRIAYVLMFLIAVELIRGSLVELWWQLSRAHAAMRQIGWRGRCYLRSNAAPQPLALAARMTIITDPLFYLLAIPAVIALGTPKGGFAGVGMISTPLLALVVPPLQAAAILLPILLCRTRSRSGSTAATGTPGT